MKKHNTWLAILIALLVVFAGFAVFALLRKPDSSVSQSAEVKPQPVAQTSATRRLEVKEWGVSVVYDQSIRTVEYNIAAPSPYAVNSGSITVTSITTSEGVKYDYDPAFQIKASAEGVDAICSNLGIGRDTRSEVISPETGQKYVQISHIGDQFYYNLTRKGGASCVMSQNATAAFNTVEQMFVNALAEDL